MTMILTGETENMINSETFDQISQIPIFINTARGPIVNEDALLKALNQNQIHSAGLDVYHDEPSPRQNDALINHPYVITTGHYAYYSDTAMEALQRRAADNMVSLLQEEIPVDCLNP